MRAVGLGLIRPCVDCGLWTGGFCGYCKAADRLPEEEWGANPMTPLCSCYDHRYDECHFCRGQRWCVPPPYRACEACGDDEFAMALMALMAMM